LSMPPAPPPVWPALDDATGWSDYAAFGDQMILSMLPDPPPETKVEEMEIDPGVRVFAITPAGVHPEDTRVYLEMHGGALIMGGGDCCRVMGCHVAQRMNMTVWTVDYRMPPKDPFPAALDDGLAAYRLALKDHRPDEIVLGGGSSGGGIAASLILRARDEGVDLPAAAILITPEADLTESGDTFSTNMGIDSSLTSSLMPANLLYAGGHDLADPYLSALFGDFSKGFPPTFLSSGTRDLFLSNTVRLHRRLRAAGVPADLHVLEAAPHGGFIGAPEDDEMNEEIRRFIEIYCPRWRSQRATGRSR
jgi:monoterpene epsilon-lactone hydrolase